MNILDSFYIQFMLKSGTLSTVSDNQTVEFANSGTGFSTVNNVSRFFTLIFIFIFVLAITYFTTKYIANLQKGKNISGNIQILETSKISQDKYIQIVKIGEKYVAIAVAKNGVTKLVDLNEDDLKFPATETDGSKGFRDILNRFTKKNDSDQ
ncbi:MAG: flagellar biosynthetic protein FliO [Lachnospiraceae bacterium]